MALTPTARAFHWTVAALVLLMIPAGLVMVREGIPRSLQDTLFLFHKNVGVAVLLIVVARAVYRWRHPPPPLPDRMPAWQKTAALATHRALYVLLFLMPVAGYVRVKAGGFPIETLDRLGVPSLVPRSDALAGAAKAVHFYGAWAIIAILALHTGAALYHALVLKDGVFGRIWPPLGRARAARRG